MKKLVFLLSAVMLFLLCKCPAKAYEDSAAESIADSIGATDFENSYLSESEIKGDKGINVFEKAFEIIKNSFSSGGMNALKSFGLIMSVIIIACVMSAMRFSSDSTLDTACGYISILCLAGAVYSVVYNVFIIVTAAMESLMLAVSSLMPIMASLYALGGSASAGAASASGLTLFLTVLSTVCTRVVLPILTTAFAMSIVSAVPSTVNLSSVVNLIKNTSTTVLAFVFTLLGFTLYLQTSIAATGDTYITRTIRFASGVFVPVIGGMLGDASRTVMASVSVIRGSVGGIGVVIVLSAVLPPIIAVVINKLMLLCCAIAAKALGCERESALLYDVNGILGVLLALVLGAGGVSILALAMFIKSGVNI